MSGAGLRSTRSSSTDARIPDAMRIGDVDDGLEGRPGDPRLRAHLVAAPGHRRKGGTGGRPAWPRPAPRPARRPGRAPGARRRLHPHPPARGHGRPRSRARPRPATSPDPRGRSASCSRPTTSSASATPPSHMLGLGIVADTGEWGSSRGREHVLGAPGYRLAGGTDEIQRNIIAERVLGLPAEHARRQGVRSPSCHAGPSRGSPGPAGAITGYQPSSVARRSRWKDASPRSTASYRARRKYRWASCSQVKPMPPCSWIASAACTNESRPRP